jgi:uncharacterized protein (TIGR02246 family)
MTSTIVSRSLEEEALAIRAESARWLRAVDTRDPDAAARFSTDDGMFLVPNVPPARGRDAVRTVWAQLLAAPNLRLEWMPHSVDVARSADMAYEIGSYQLAMDGPAGRIEDDGKYVVVWRKTERGWQVAADIFNSSRPPA